MFIKNFEDGLDHLKADIDTLKVGSELPFIYGIPNGTVNENTLKKLLIGHYAPIYKVMRIERSGKNKFTFIHDILFNGQEVIYNICKDQGFSKIDRLLGNGISVNKEQLLLIIDAMRSKDYDYILEKGYYVAVSFDFEKLKTILDDMIYDRQLIEKAKANAEKVKDNAIDDIELYNKAIEKIDEREKNSINRF